MSTSILDRLRERRKEAWKQAKTLADKAAAENRTFSETEQFQWESVNAQIEQFDARIGEVATQEQRAYDVDAQMTAIRGRPRPDPPPRYNPPQSTADRELMDQFRSMILERNPRPIDVYWENPRSAYQPGIERRDLLTTGPANFSPVGFYPRLVAHMVESSSVLAAGATVLNTSSGEPMRIPRSTAMSTAGIVAEAAAIPESDPTLGVITLGAFKYGFLVQVSGEMVADAGVDLPSYLSREAGQAIGLGLGAHLITGTGTGQPRGVVTDATVGVTGPTGTATTLGNQGTVGQGTDLLNDLYASIVEPYTRSTATAWLMRSATLGIIRRLKAATSGELVGNVILEPSTVPGAAASLLGKPVFVDAGVALPAANAKSIVFGDMSRYFVRIVNGIRFERSDEYAFGNDLVTFRALLRADAALVDTTGAVKYFQHSAT